MKKAIAVTLHNSSGSRVTEIQPKGFPTRHISTRIEGINTEPVTLTSNPVSNPFTEPVLLDILEKMTALQNEDAPLCEGWHCEDAIYKVTRINLKHNVSSPELRQMLFDLTERGRLEHKTEYGLNKFRLFTKPALHSLLMEVDAILAGGVEHA